ncbi:Serine/threonine protein kinase [Trema orientale]|uniref:Receptor-like serine/threonine-protein kinase n=1 Tax=Trema orientale TaxID=63057 RepID=A0A2P5DUH7_TREOI|nr:Serine/threonine protein kinase [Trema orientale]
MAKNQENIIIIPPLLIIIFIVTLFFPLVFSVTDTIRPRDTIRGNETLVSATGIFELGFFGDVVSDSYYMGIWFKSDPKKKPVWVANRENPTLGTSGLLQLRPEDGNLVLIDRRQLPWILNSAAVATAPNTSATLLDTGNLVLREEGNESSTIVWQSFDYPTDTFLPGMRIGWFGLNTDEPRFQLLVSWVSPQNPSHGPFTVGVDNSTRTKLTVWRGNSAQMDIGFWEREGIFRFIFQNSSSSPAAAMDSGDNFSYVTNQGEKYFSFSVNGDRYVSKWFVIESIGNFDEYSMAIDGTISSVSHRLCEDPSGGGGGSSGKCLASMPSACENGDVFGQMNGTVIPTWFYVSGSMNWGFSDCEFMCRSNCSCGGFASVEDDRLSGCQLFYGSKTDLMKIVQKGNGVVYVRGDDKPIKDGINKWKLRLGIMVPLAFLLIIIPIFLWGYLRRRKREDGEHRRANISGNNEEARLFQMGSNNMSPMRGEVIRAADKIRLSTSQKEQDLPLFSFSSIVSATNYFATSNKLGEGGFGPGRLQDGQDIAVKRLSKISRQGLEEFKNEVSLISKLQHRNLVRLLGCCIDAEESILVYEYMPNKSLDSFIFDSTKREHLDWRKRLNIIEGIAQGLLYLHKYSRLRIIHRDLKTSNILLDSEMNPKISDFGMARIFADNDTRVKTNRVVGTYGYMSPEYAMDGLFSEKSDVFSFGVIMLELVSGKKNIAFFETDHSLNLLGNAWHLWREGSSTDLMDSTLRDSCSTGEVVRYVQLGLLCVQERATDRPTMSDVVFMLSNETLELPLPKEPAFLSQLSSTDAESSSSRQRLYSRNDITISEVHAR